MRIYYVLPPIMYVVLVYKRIQETVWMTIIRSNTIQRTMTKAMYQMIPCQMTVGILQSEHHRIRKFHQSRHAS
jgi:hypothetical protein